MSEKRRDNRGHILRNGECQRKDGLYQYDYIDIQLVSLIVNDSVTNEAITHNEKKFLTFVKNDKHFCKCYNVKKKIKSFEKAVL